MRKLALVRLPNDLVELRGRGRGVPVVEQEAAPALAHGEQWLLVRLCVRDVFVERPGQRGARLFCAARTVERVAQPPADEAQVEIVARMLDHVALGDLEEWHAKCGTTLRREGYTVVSAHLVGAGRMLRRRRQMRHERLELRVCALPLASKMKRARGF